MFTVLDKFETVRSSVDKETLNFRRAFDRERVKPRELSDRRQGTRDGLTGVYNMSSE
jgi:hypothetical protein